MLRIPCTLMRGGTSKGACFLARDVPSDPAARDRLLLAVMGSPDPRQIDGIGGADRLTSRVAIVAQIPEGRTRRMLVEHPTGASPVSIVVEQVEGRPVGREAALVSTSRPRFAGDVLVPDRVLASA